MKNILILLSVFFLVQCGTTVPTEKKNHKGRKYNWNSKKSFLDEKSEKVKDHLIFKKISRNNQSIYQLKIKEHFKIPEVLMREDIARKYITEKKRATMVHNPIGEGTGSNLLLE